MTKYEFIMNIITSVKKINSSNYEDYFIAFHEGILRDDEKDMVYLFLDKNPNIKNDFNIYGKIKLKPEDIKFPNKNRLKKQKTISMHKRFGLTMSVVAACIALLLVFSHQ